MTRKSSFGQTHSKENGFHRVSLPRNIASGTFQPRHDHGADEVAGGPKASRTDDGPSEAVVPTDDGEEGEEGDGLDEADYHTLLVATLRELRELKLVAPRRHELQRVENTGVCGMPECKEPGCRLACITCKVRLCRNTWCWNQHINDNRGDVVGSKVEFRICEDQGEKKKCPGRAREQIDA